MKKACFFAAAIISAMLAPAHAEEPDKMIAEGIVMAVLYDRQCEKLPQAYADSAMAGAVELKDASVLHTALQTVLREFKREGPITWCKRTKAAFDIVGVTP